MPASSSLFERMRDAAQEVRELGFARTFFRVRWELRSRLMPFESAIDARPLEDMPHGTQWLEPLPFPSSAAIAHAIRPYLTAARLETLQRTAEQALTGKVLCFSQSTAAFGNPIQWHRNPLTGLSWDPTAHWTVALADRRPGDVKFCWEVARFPHAYHLARSAAFSPNLSEQYAAALWAQMQRFVAENPPGLGIHWSSGQEIAFRLLAWLFAAKTLLLQSNIGSDAAAGIALALAVGARRIEKHIDFAQHAVHNNHLISEALALYGAGTMLSQTRAAVRWRALGRRILDEEADRQFYEDGGYLQQSHNYHRLALQNYLWAALFARAAGEPTPPRWRQALERSLDFLHAHQNPSDGRLPNYGANDGALPSVLSTCDFGDMRPTLQAVSLLVRGERLYEAGPWDEEAAWLLGTDVLAAPLRARKQVSRSFPHSGHHVLRGRDPSSFSAFRCGTLRDRFSQIDMLHLDVWWRGQNVLADGGSYRYNAAPEWLAHFTRSSSHNTVTIDGLEQMLHYRPFKVIYLTVAKLYRFDDREHYAIVEGEHYGYQRHAGGCIHRRTVLYFKDDLWIVIDRVTGSGHHETRLHWLGGHFPWVAPADGNGMQLQTAAGVFSVVVHDGQGTPLEADVVTGVDSPEPRGWLSRHYGHKTAVPSLAATQRGQLPHVFVSVLCAGAAAVECRGAIWSIATETASVNFAIADGRLAADPTLS